MVPFKLFFMCFDKNRDFGFSSWMKSFPALSMIDVIWMKLASSPSEWKRHCWYFPNYSTLFNSFFSPPFIPLPLHQTKLSCYLCGKHQSNTLQHSESYLQYAKLYKVLFKKWERGRRENIIHGDWLICSFWFTHLFLSFHMKRWGRFCLFLTAPPPIIPLHQA